jgi:hypothetical protein
MVSDPNSLLLAQTLAPFAEVAAWAERNGHDLNDFDMLLRGPKEQIAGHLQVQSVDFIKALEMIRSMLFVRQPCEPRPHASTIRARPADGYMVVRARGPPGPASTTISAARSIRKARHFAADQVVKVYRSEAEVFAQDSVASFLMKPVTNDHPSQPVTAANWRDLCQGRRRQGSSRR